jgi:hypothetical protein
VNEPVDVASIYEHNKGRMKPVRLQWRAVSYELGPIDFYHQTRVGDTILHHFSLCDSAAQIHIRLCFDSSRLCWTLQQWSDAWS